MSNNWEAFYNRLVEERGKDYADDLCTEIFHRFYDVCHYNKLSKYKDSFKLLYYDSVGVRSDQHFFEGLIEYCGNVYWFDASDGPHSGSEIIGLSSIYEYIRKQAIALGC